ncbi:MAG: hypothetical protein N4A61_11705 [Pelagimonas sp.]|jgi:hypothetical protein|nr:hypothetical protein [Pelagimonas sp.]
MKLKAFAIGTAVAFSGMLGAALPASAADIIGSYVAYIGQDDLYNSKGARLTQPWQVLRQDRANFHKFGISQRGDEWDPFFSDYNNRAVMERMVMNGSIEPQARQDLLRGGATVFVRIYGRGNTGDYVRVTVVGN